MTAEDKQRDIKTIFPGAKRSGNNIKHEEESHTLSESWIYHVISSNETIYGREIAIFVFPSGLQQHIHYVEEQHLQNTIVVKTQKLYRTHHQFFSHSDREYVKTFVTANKKNKYHFINLHFTDLMILRRKCTYDDFVNTRLY